MRFDSVALVVTFGVILVAELPDKSALASVVLGSRYRALAVWLGVAAAFTLHVVLAVAVGSLVARIPEGILRIVSAVLFAAGAIVVLRGRRGEPNDEPSTPTPAPTLWRVAAGSFLLVAVAEWGDITQITTANLAARFDAPLAVGLGAVLALWTVAGLAVAMGGRLVRLVPAVYVRRAAAAIMAALAMLSLLGVP